jgi:hypothetical protein
MVSEKQVRRLFNELASEQTLALAAARAGMHPETARRYRRLGKLPSEVAAEHTWRTRQDPFEEVWEEAVEFLKNNAGLEAKTIFDYLQRTYSGKFQDGQLRTFQRRVKVWRATEGPGKAVFFPQVHEPGKLSQSDFTDMSGLGIRIAGQLFEHLLYHFVLTYSNWEDATICFSESFEALSEGLQNALWRLGGTPAQHQTDRLSSAVNNISRREEFTRRYQGLMDHYGIEGRKINAEEPHENGDVEQRHNRFKRAVDQALMLRGSRDFDRRKDYEEFLGRLKDQLNAGRADRLAQEQARLGPLPSRRLESWKRVQARVLGSSLISVDRNTYSVPSRLIGEEVEVRLHAEHLEIRYAQRTVETIPRLRGRGKHHVQYRHVIDWLVRKPGAFENYRYREAMYPTSRFRMAYDALKERAPGRADRQYLKVLQLAAGQGEVLVDNALRILLAAGRIPSPEAVEELLARTDEIVPATHVYIEPVDLRIFDTLLGQAVGL